MLKMDAGIVAVLVVIAGLIWVVKEPFRLWHTTGADGHQHPAAGAWAAWSTAAFLIVGFMVAASVSAARDKSRPRRARGGVRMLAATPPPPCRHPGAVKVENLHDPDGPPWAYWCPDCGTQLDPGTGLPMPDMVPVPRCCGAGPGAVHWGNCPNGVNPRRKR